MVKLTGPAISAQAAGKLGQAITLVTSKRGTYMKKLTAPRQPRSGGQVSTRSLIKFLSKQWATTTPADRDSWRALATETNIAPYHAYLAYNATRFRNFLMPTIEFPPSTAPYPPVMEFPHAFDGVASIRFRAKIDRGPDNWGYLLCRSQTSGFTPGWHNVIAIFPRVPGAFTYYLDTPLTPGYYYYRCMAFSPLAQPTPFSVEKGAQAT